MPKYAVGDRIEFFWLDKDGNEQVRPGAVTSVGKNIGVKLDYGWGGKVSPRSLRPGTKREV